jgi:hypothetical protein
MEGKTKQQRAEEVMQKIVAILQEYHCDIIVEQEAKVAGPLVVTEAKIRIVAQED